MVNEHIQAALDELEEARRKSPMGTGMMIESAMDELRRVQDTFEEGNE